jgi:flagellar basal body-associated protein FliL
MAKKVTLDVLDVASDQKAPEKAPVPVASPEETPAGPERPRRRFAPAWPAWLPRRRLWLLAPGILIVAAAPLAVLGLLSGDRQEPEPRPAVAAPAEAALVAEPLILLPGFVVDLTDERGVARILFCDAALAPEKMPAAQGDPNWTEARNRIYLTLKGQKIADLLSAAGRRQLKATLSDELKGLAGLPPLRAIYFTAFQIM